MADYIEFTVNVKDGDNVDSTSAIDEKIKDSSDKTDLEDKLTRQAKQNMDENKLGKTPDESKSSKAMKAFIINEVVKDGTKMALNLAEQYAVQQYKYSGNTALSNRISNKITTVKGVVNFGESIIGYGAAGAATGLAGGALIGAIIGLVKESISTMIDYTNSKSELQWNLENERRDANKQANRLGIISAGRGRISFTEYQI